MALYVRSPSPPVGVSRPVNDALRGGPLRRAMASATASVMSGPTSGAWMMWTPPIGPYWGSRPPSAQPYPEADVGLVGP